MLALPFPERGGSFADLRKFLNVETDADFYLAGGFAIGAMHRPARPPQPGGGRLDGNMK